MSVHSPLVTSLPPSGRHIADFDLVAVGGRLLLVGSTDRDRVVCTWDPAGDRWTEYVLGVPAEDRPHTRLTVLGAAVVDGRVVVGGGGGDDQGFAVWDLETGAIRLSTPECVGSVVGVDFGGRSRFLVGFAGLPGVQLWDPSVVESDGRQDDDPYDSLVHVEELECQSGTSSAVAAGLVAGKPVVVAGGRDGGVVVWDVDEGRYLAEFDDLDETPTEFALASVDGRTRIVAAGGRSLVLGDPETNEWDEPLTVPGDEISCLTAGTVRGRPYAATGARDGTIRVWDLAERRPLGQPLQGHGSEVFGLRLADLDGRPVIVSSAHGDSVHLWELP